MEITAPTHASLNTASDTKELCSLLAVEEGSFTYAVKHAPILYREIHLKKVSGGYRVINAPTDELKAIQRAILDKILASVRLPVFVYGFAKEKTIIENARLHSKSEFVLNADIKDFFPSVHFTRVQKVFTALGAGAFSARRLTGLTTLNYCLPQGAPTSPYLAALALRDMDARIRSLCVANHLLYSRYFDDIVISGSEQAHAILGTLTSIVESEGYRLHVDPAKLRLYGPKEERRITGIFVREGTLYAPKEQEIADYISELKAQGISALRSDNPAKERMSIRGKIAFISQVDPAAGTRLGKEFESINW